MALWYSLRNNYWSGNANNWDDSLGLMKTDFSHKPAYDTFKAYTPGAGPAPAPAPRPAPAPAPAPTTGPDGSDHAPDATGTRPKKRTRTSLRVGTSATTSATTAAVANRTRSYSLGGHVVASSGGFVTIRLQRPAGSSRAYRTVRTLRVRLTSAGNFATQRATARLGSLARAGGLRWQLDRPAFRLGLRLPPPLVSASTRPKGWSVGGR